MIRFIKYQQKELISICIALVGCFLIWKLPTLLSWAKSNNSLVVTILAISIITAITALLIWIGFRSFHFFYKTEHRFAQAIQNETDQTRILDFIKNVKKDVEKLLVVIALFLIITGILLIPMLKKWIQTSI
jgi:predicted PurR-regulated permease PerM